jgi:hypothetical protein
VLGDLSVETEARTNSLAVAIRRIVDRRGRATANDALLSDVLVTIAQIAAALDLRSPVSAFHLGDLVARHRRFLAQLARLRLEVVGLGLALVDQGLQFAVLGLQRLVGGLESVHALRHGLHLLLQCLDLGLAGRRAARLCRHRHRRKRQSCRNGRRYR